MKQIKYKKLPGEHIKILTCMVWIVTAEEMGLISCLVHWQELSDSLQEASPFRGRNFVNSVSSLEHLL